MTNTNQGRSHTAVQNRKRKYLKANQDCQSIHGCSEKATSVHRYLAPDDPERDGDQFFQSLCHRHHFEVGHHNNNAPQKPWVIGSPWRL